MELLKLDIGIFTELKHFQFIRISHNVCLNTQHQNLNIQ